MGQRLDNLTSELSTLATDVLDALEAEELAAGGFVSDLEVRAGHAFLRPRVPRMVSGLVNKALDKYGHLSVTELAEMLGGLFAERKAES